MNNMETNTILSREKIAEFNTGILQGKVAELNKLAQMFKMQELGIIKVVNKMNESICKIDIQNPTNSGFFDQIVNLKESKNELIFLKTQQGDFLYLKVMEIFTLCEILFFHFSNSDKKVFRQMSQI